MNKLIMVCGLFVSVFFLPQSYAAAPSCHTHASAAPYCQYRGKVEQVFVNDANKILVFFDSLLDLSLPTTVGISGVTRSEAATVVIGDNPTFAQYFYSAVLAAQARGSEIRIQMRSVSNGYLVADRIWVYD